MSMSVEGKTTLTIPYEVSQPSEVLVYAGTAANSRSQAESGTAGTLKIYNIEWESEPTGISATRENQVEKDQWYMLDGRKVRTSGSSPQGLAHGVYVVNGRKVVRK